MRLELKQILNIHVNSSFWLNVLFCKIIAINIKVLRRKMGESNELINQTSNRFLMT